MSGHACSHGAYTSAHGACSTVRHEYCKPHNKEAHDCINGRQGTYRGNNIHARASAHVHERTNKQSNTSLHLRTLFLMVGG